MLEISRFKCGINCLIDTMASVVSSGLTVRQPPEAPYGTSFSCTQVKRSSPGNQTDPVFPSTVPGQLTQELLSFVHPLSLKIVDPKDGQTNFMKGVESDRCTPSSSQDTLARLVICFLPSTSVLVLHLFSQPLPFLPLYQDSSFLLVSTFFSLFLSFLLS